MRHIASAAALALCLPACSGEAPSPQPTASGDGPATEGVAESEAAPPAAVTAPAATRADPAALAPEGLGEIVVGKAPPASLKADSTQISDSCQTYSDKARGIYAMTDGKVVARITAMKTSRVVTAKGIAPGATEAQVRKAYPDIAEEPHKYWDAPAKYLDWRPNGGTSGLRFEIDPQGKVNAIHAGREPEIEYVEGCG